MHFHIKVLGKIVIKHCRSKPTRPLLRGPGGLAPRKLSKKQYRFRHRGSCEKYGLPLVRRMSMGAWASHPSIILDATAKPSCCLTARVSPPNGAMTGATSSNNWVKDFPNPLRPDPLVMVINLR